MPSSNTAAPVYVWARQILDDLQITDRCLRQWIARGKFPAPDVNINGRNAWLDETYSAWKADARAGKYSQQRRPIPQAQAA